MELKPVLETKKPWLSKTIIINAALGLAAFFPPALEWMKSNTEIVMAGFSILNIILRAVTKDKISLED